MQAAVLGPVRSAEPGFVMIYDPDGLPIATVDPVTRERWDLTGKLLGRMRLRWDNAAGAGNQEKPRVAPRKIQRAAAGELGPWYADDLRADREPRSDRQVKRRRR